MFDAIYSKPFFINQAMVYQLIRGGKDIVVVADTTALARLLKMANRNRSNNVAAEPNLNPSKHSVMHCRNTSVQDHYSVERIQKVPDIQQLHLLNIWH